jgi:hypothetical protein
MKTPRMPMTPWNKGKLVGQKSPLKLSEIWSIRIRLQLFQRNRELASIASCGHVIGSKFEFKTFVTVSMSRTGQQSCSKRRSDQFNLK